MNPATRRAIRKAIIFATFGLLLLLGVFPGMEYFFGGVTERNCGRIKPGMTEAQVHSVLGGPPSGSLGSNTAKVRWKTWSAPGILVDVFFDPDGKVMDKARVVVEQDREESRFTLFLRSWGILPQ